LKKEKRPTEIRIVIVQLVKGALAGVEGLEPPAPGFGDR
jgi:hypothetical protein